MCVDHCLGLSCGCQLLFITCIYISRVETFFDIQLNIKGKKDGESVLMYVCIYVQV